MHDCARLIVKDGVIFVLAILSEAFLATLAQTVKIVRAEIPTTWPLEQVAADSRNIADLRRCRMFRSFGQRLISPANDFAFMQPGQRSQWPDAQLAILLLYLIKPTYVTYVDQTLGRVDALLHTIEQINSSRLDYSAIRSFA